MRHHRDSESYERSPCRDRGMTVSVTQAVVGVPSLVYPAVSACSALSAPLQIYCFKTNRPVLRVRKLTPARAHL